MCYHIAMSTPTGALAPTVIPGEVVAPAAVIGPNAFPTHNYLNVVRDLVSGRKYHNEDDVRTALAAVDEYEKRMLAADHRHVLSEDDAAPHEDVSQRIPPRGSAPVVPATAPAIDYNKLAAALMAAGFGQQAPAVQEGSSSE